MKLAFTTTINNKPTLFVKKIWKGLLDMGVITELELLILFIYPYSSKFRTWHDNPEDEHIDHPKLHTLRENKQNRWKQGKEIEFVINQQTDNEFQFAPTLPVTSVQKVEIIDNEVYVDDRRLQLFEITKLAKNDGFENVAEFFKYFGPNYTGTIIHWTNLTY